MSASLFTFVHSTFKVSPNFTYRRNSESLHPYKQQLFFSLSTRRNRQKLPVATLDDRSAPYSDNQNDIEISRSSNLQENFTSENPMKWSEIPFQNIQEELEAIDKYEKTEKLPEHDPWPKFLRGAAYECWGQPKLALAQYALTKHAGGLRQVPEIWERRAYNVFKIGEVIAANLYFDVASRISNEADGNYLHFLHWFYDNFDNFLPKRNGPPAPVQNAICKYCIGKLKETREILAAQIATAVTGVEHSLLWMMAASYRLSPDKGLPESDIRLFNIALKECSQWDSRLSLLVLLFSNAAQKKSEEQKKYYNQIINEIATKGMHDDVYFQTYLALYHDAFTRDSKKRDEFLDSVCALEGTSSPNDVENFLYHTAKNRLSIPPDASMHEIPEPVSV